MKLLLLRLLSYFPRPLPVGLTEFDAWSNRIIALSGQFADADSMKWALASNVMHLGAQNAFVSDHYFVKSMRKAAANQVASQVFQDIKLKQQLAAEAKLQTQVEATTPESVVSNEQQAN